jgi:hypothetical protein
MVYPRTEVATMSPREFPATRAFCLVMVPAHNGHTPEEEDNYAITDPLYACVERSHCDCHVDPFGRRWRMESIRAGGEFDGRLRESFYPPDHGNAAKEWDRNIRPASEFVGPISAYALVTPDGIWLESPQPEQRDLVVTGRVESVEAGRLTRVQVSWREFVADMIRSHPGCFVLGCEVALSSEPVRHCPYIE